MHPGTDLTGHQVAGGDLIHYTLTTPATPASNAGTYPITVTVGANPNYSVTPTDGTLTVSPDFIAGRCTYTHESGEVIEIYPDTIAFFPQD